MSVETTELLKTFSVNQLRDLATAMSARGVELSTRNLGQSEILLLLESKESDPFLALYAHRIEAVTPYKHLFVYTVDSTQSNFETMKSKIEAAYPGFIGGYREVTPELDDLEPETCLADEFQKRIYLKLVHRVEMSTWESVSRTQKQLKEFRRRHPVVITLKPVEGIVTVGFPGFTYLQGDKYEGRVTYSEIAAQATKFLSEHLQIECGPFNAKPAIDALLEEEPQEVSEIRRNVRPKAGGRFGFDAGEEGKVAIAFTEFLQQEGNIRVNEREVRQLFRRSGASDIVLSWKRLDILTRVALFQDGPEILFVWRGGGPSSTLVDSVLRKLVTYERLFAKPGLSSVRSELANASLNEMIRPAVIAQRCGVSQSEVVQILDIGMAKGDFEPRFRVNTTAILLNFSNVWYKSPTDLPREVTDEHGNTLDLTIPSNIEVAFQRVR